MPLLDYAVRDVDRTQLAAFFAIAERTFRTLPTPASLDLLDQCTWKCRQRLQDLTFGEIYILQRVEEKVFQCLLSHF